MTEQCCSISLWSSEKSLLIILCDNFLMRVCWWSRSSMIFCMTGKGFLWVKKAVKANYNAYIDPDTIYCCLYYICLFYHNLFITKLLGDVSERPKGERVFFWLSRKGKRGRGNRETTLILSVKSFDTKGKKEKIRHIKYVKDLL